MVNAPEFWSREALREKTKSPFELAISAARALHADINQPMQLYNWINRMGQDIYAYQAPTGFPDKGSYWINTGSLLNRMNFGLAIASGRVPGISINLAMLNNNHEPESAEAALITYSKLMLPERNLDASTSRLKPLLNNPQLADKINQAAAGKAAAPKQPKENDLVNDELNEDSTMNKKLTKEQLYSLNQVVGIIIGSPEFQRR